MPTETRYEDVFEIKQGTKAYRAQETINFAETLLKEISAAYIKDDISHRRYKKLIDKHACARDKAWTVLMKAGSLAPTTTARINRNYERILLQVEVTHS